MTSNYDNDMQKWLGNALPTVLGWEGAQPSYSSYPHICVHAGTLLLITYSWRRKETVALEVFVPPWLWEGECWIALRDALNAHTALLA